MEFNSNEASGGNLHTQQMAVITTPHSTLELFMKGNKLHRALPPTRETWKEPEEGQIAVSSFLVALI